MDRIDRNFKKIGFKKVQEWSGGVAYEKWVEKYKFTHRIEIQIKNSCSDLIHSYSADNPVGYDYFSSVGMSIKEAKLAIKKLKKLQKRNKSGGKADENISRLRYNKCGGNMKGCDSY